MSAEPTEQQPDEGSTDHDERIGLVVADRYRIDKVLGVGGMGGVYEAQHQLIGKRVALKCLHREYARDRDIVERFKREARAATLIGNDHIIDVTDMGDLPDGAPFLVMEYLAGRPLASLIDEGALSIKRALHITRQICDALGAAHDKGIVHRDLKPENVFLIERNGDRDFVKVLDFGISKMHDSGAEKKGLTRTGMAMGTPSYMSPEQAQGSKDVDLRTDIWALGVMLYEMLAARRPFEADSYPLLLMHIVATDPDPVRMFRKDVPPGLEEIVMRCLVKDVSVRFATMKELSAALAEFASLETVVEVTAPDAVAQRAITNPADRFKQTALGRKNRKSEPDAPAAPIPGTQPAGSISPPPSSPPSAPPAGPPPARSGTQLDGTATDAPDAPARRARGTADTEPRGATPLGSEPRLGADGRRHEPTAAEVRAYERNLGDRGAPKSALFAAIGVIALVLAGGAIYFNRPAETRATEPTTGTAPPTPTPTPPTPVPTPVVAPPPVEPARTEVRVRIRATPAEARILIDDVEFPNPMDALQPRRLTPIHVRVERDGYQSIERLVIFDEDRSYEFELARGHGVRHLGLSGREEQAPAATPTTMDTTTMETSMAGSANVREEW